MEALSVEVSVFAKITCDIGCTKSTCKVIGTKYLQVRYTGLDGLAGGGCEWANRTKEGKTQYRDDGLLLILVDLVYSVQKCCL